MTVRSEPRGLIVLVLLSLTQFILVIDVSIVNVALNSIKESLAFSEANLQWILSAYTLTFGGLLLLGGRAADLFGRRRVFMIGLVDLHLRLGAVRVLPDRADADPGPRVPGRRRGDHLPGRAVDPDDHLPRGQRA